MPSSAPGSPAPSSPSSSTILLPSSNLMLSSDLTAAKPQYLYKLSSHYFLTKHFPEASQAIQSLLRSHDLKWKQKAWGLYLVILDNGLKLSDEEGRRVWSRQGWEVEVSRVKGSKLWDELLDTFDGDIGSIGGEVVMAMYAPNDPVDYGRIQVSLHHGDTKLGQLKVEEWLAAVPAPFPYESAENLNGVTGAVTNGTGKVKDFYGKVLELYCLSLLPRNEEWDYANSFIDMNDFLSEAKKKVLTC